MVSDISDYNYEYCYSQVVGGGIQCVIKDFVSLFPEKFR